MEKLNSLKSERGLGGAECGRALWAPLDQIINPNR